MVEATETQEHRPNLWWWLGVGYGGLVSFLWLFLGMRRLLRWLEFRASAEAAVTAGNLELAGRIQAFSGSLVVDMGYTFVVALVCGFAVFALLRRSWNAWDYATVAVGFTAVLSLVFLCARNRVMFFIPLSTMPLLALLYTPGLKLACGVRPSEQRLPEEETPPITASNSGEIEQEIGRERALIAQLSQNLDVFEVERGIDTDTFVARYANGLEEETPDNAEWFSIARAVRRSRERITDLETQLSIMSNGHRRQERT